MAMPTLAEIDRLVWAMLIGWLSSAWMRSTVSVACSASHCGSTTTNSSPDSRPAMSEPAVPLQARGHLAQQLIAGGVAQGVVDLLEAVQVDEQHRQLLVVARGGGNGLVGLGLQQAAVGQAGQAVVEGQLADARRAFSRSSASAHRCAQASTRRWWKSRGGIARLAEIEGEGADGAALAVADRRGPAGR
jgi:hypothetical protein